MGRRWSEEAAFGSRANFFFTPNNAMSNPGYLKIRNVTLADEGLYRCRIDFKNSPARHFRVKLNVIGECDVNF